MSATCRPSCSRASSTDDAARRLGSERGLGGVAGKARIVRSFAIGEDEEIAVGTFNGVAKVKGAIASMTEDVDAALARDPAGGSRLEMALASPGLHAVWSHRVTHAMWQRGGRWKLPARLGSQVTRAVTGVEIHPGATIGRRFFIDHGMGVVIGETSEVGDDCMLYNGVNLGGRTLAKVKRHPTLGNGVTVGAGARILGPIVVGDGAQVGANAVVVKDVPASGVAVGVPATVRVPAQEHDSFIDPAVYI